MNSHDYQKYDDQIRAKKSALFSALITWVGSMATFLTWYLLKDKFQLAWLVSSIVCFVALAFTFFQRKLRSLEFHSFVTVFVLSAVLVANTEIMMQFIHSNNSFHYFQAYKLAVIIIALIAPVPTWLGYVVIVACPTISIALYYLLIPPELRSHIPIQEPWDQLIYAGVAGFLLTYRLRSIETVRRLSRLQFERKALDDLAHIFFGLRDLTNTPIQSIELATKLLEKEKISVEEGTKYIGASLTRLRELSEILASCEQEIEWKDEESAFDAVTLLQHMIADLKARERQHKAETSMFAKAQKNPAAT